MGLIQKGVEQVHKNREIFAYGIVGILNTVLNFGVYYLLCSIHIHYLIANLISWIVAFIFSFWANKVHVFQSNDWTYAVFRQELWSFFCCSIGTGVLDMLMIFFMVDIMEMSEAISKIINVIVVMIINYFARKFFVFKKGGRKQ